MGKEEYILLINNKNKLAKISLSGLALLIFIVLLDSIYLLKYSKIIKYYINLKFGIILFFMIMASISLF